MCEHYFPGISQPTGKGISDRTLLLHLRQNIPALIRIPF